jgi:hypothetical protein
MSLNMENGTSFFKLIKFSENYFVFLALGALAKLRNKTISFVMFVLPTYCLSVCPCFCRSALNNLVLTEKTFIKFYI